MKIEKDKKGENNMTPTYIGDIDLNEETLAHFGIKGMKWGKRKARILKSKVKNKIRETKRKYGLGEFKNGKKSEEMIEKYKNWHPNTKDERMAYVSSIATNSSGNKPENGKRYKMNSKYDIGSGKYDNAMINLKETESYRRKKKKK